MSPKKTFRNYLTFKNSTTRFAKAVAHHAMGQGADTTVQKEFGRFQIMVFHRIVNFHQNDKKDESLE